MGSGYKSIDRRCIFQSAVNGPLQGALERKKARLKRGGPEKVSI
jgi:hypothetical protein